VSNNRIARLRARLSGDEHFLVSNLINVRYLTGFSGSNGALLVGPETAILVTDSRYEEQAAKQISDVELVISRDLFGELLKQVTGNIVAVEAEDLSIGAFNELAKRFPKIEFKLVSKQIEALRVVKDDFEIQQISRACEISVSALSQVQGKIQPGVSERNISMWLEYEMRVMGADDKAFDTIVASGPNSSIPHHEPSDRLIQVGDFVKIDFGAKIAGYHADCTRTFVVGRPTDQQREIYAAVADAQLAGRSALRAGAVLSDVVATVVASLTNTGFNDRFTHGLGHGVGLAIHEDPFFGAANNAKIEANTVITVEPGVYLPGVGGVRIEDTVVVTDIGYRNLTNFSYELIEL
jgi:Xaa-Pro aminopeptidase